jgi:hypothetical protein
MPPPLKREKSVVGITEPLTVTSQPSSPLQISRTSSKQMGKRNASGSMSQRLDNARRRTDAALMIQRAWHRWYVSAARRKRLQAARVIQHAWAGTFRKANAKKELEFMRWLRRRREALRWQWRQLVRRVEQRRIWALVTIAAMKNVWIWRRRLARRREQRFAIKLQRWWRRRLHDMRTRGDVLAAMELRELLRLEHLMRSVLNKQFCASVVAVANAGYAILDEGYAATLKRWHEEHKIPLELNSQLEAALGRFEFKQNAVLPTRQLHPSAAHCAEPRAADTPALGSTLPTQHGAATHYNPWEDQHVIKDPWTRCERRDANVQRPKHIPRRPMSSRERPVAAPHFSVCVRPPSATVRRARLRNTDDNVIVSHPFAPL